MNPVRERVCKTLMKIDQFVTHTDERVRSELLSNGVKHIRSQTRRFISVLAALGTLLPMAASAEGSLENPLNPEFSSVPAFIAGALKVLVIVALPIITLFVVVAGFLFVFARGNEQKISEARKNFVYVIIGALLILGAWLIATLIGSTVTQLVGN